MKIETELNPQTQRLKLKYDREIRDMFSTVARFIAEFSDPQAFGILAKKLNDEVDLARGAKLFSRLGDAKRRHVEVDSEEVAGALNVICWSIIQLASAGHSAKPLRLVLIALANLALVRVPSFRLPPPSEVFVRRKTPLMVQQTYEAICSWSTGSEPGFLVVSTANEMWLELSEILNPDPDFRQLVDFLEISSVLYRLALKALAEENNK
jgi:hypothetical protein